MLQDEINQQFPIRIEKRLCFFDISFHGARLRRRYDRLGFSPKIAVELRFFADTPITITDSSGATVYREPNAKNP